MLFKNSKIVRILFIFLGLQLYQCSGSGNVTSDSNQETDKISDSTQTHEVSLFKQVEFERPTQQTGYFFTFRFRTSEDRINNIDEFLNYLSEEKFNIISAWYFAGPHCGNLRTIYHPQLIVQLSSKDLRLNNYNFVYITDKIIFKCSENTIRFVPKD